MATSKAMGTGRNAATRATRRMPPMVTWATSAWGGKSSTTNAPRMAARIISGRATRATYQKLLAKERESHGQDDDVQRGGGEHRSEDGFGAHAGSEESARDRCNAVGANRQRNA